MVCFSFSSVCSSSSTMHIFTLILLLAAYALANATDVPDELTQSQKLMRYLMRKRGQDSVKPMLNASQPVEVQFKMELYQIIELRQQYVYVSAWVVERWHDEFMFWNPADFDNITTIKIPHHQIWTPDTTLYNTLVMKDDDQRRLLFTKVTTDYEKRRALVELLYPALYKFSCLLFLQYFPFDSQECKMMFGSWTSDNSDIDYFTYKEQIGTSNYIMNEGWSLMATAGHRKEVKYVCCPQNYTILDFTLYLRRKPLFYLVNLVIPTFIITLIAITGFFTTSSTTGVRDEKISLCITTLLSMSILMLMVSDQMPSTSTSIPLISWFYMCAIVIISVGALAASFVISIQKFGRMGQRLPAQGVQFAKWLSTLSLTRVPHHLRSHNSAPPAENGRKQSTMGAFAKHMFCGGPEVTYHVVENPGVLADIKEDSPPVAFAPAIGKKRSCPRLYKDATLNTLTENEELARIEYDWLATAIERCTFILFVCTFLALSLGINIVGLLHWLSAQPPDHQP